MLNQSEVIRQSLLQQVERSSQELAAASGKLARHQHAATKLTQCQTEVAHLQRRVRRRGGGKKRREGSGERRRGGGRGEGKKGGEEGRDRRRWQGEGRKEERNSVRWRGEEGGEK